MTINELREKRNQAWQAAKAELETAEAELLKYKWMDHLSSNNLSFRVN